MKPKLLVFASGTATGGGSGFENLVQASRDGRLEAEIIGVVSNRLNGGVHKRAQRLRVPFLYFPQVSGIRANVTYQRFAVDSRADFFALSGWLKLVSGLDLATRFSPKTVFNIHPGPLPAFGGPGMYGHHVHEAVIAAFNRGEVTHSAVSMHFVTPEYDRGPIIFRFRVRIYDYDTPDTLGKRVNAWEHYWQPIITNLIVNSAIRWDGNEFSLPVVPKTYQIDRGSRYDLPDQIPEGEVL